VSKIAISLEKVKDKLHIPVVYNSSGYELVKSLKMLDGLVDIYLPDYKYFSSEISAKYSNAPDYREHAEKAILEMFSQVGACKYGEDGVLKSGIIVRHLVLPSCRTDSINVINRIAEILPKNDILVSIMSQYTPEFASDCGFKELGRRVTSFEYDSVLREAERLGLSGFSQSRSSASGSYTPNFKDSKL
jgi:putative pyruvate formate lyase activating enzyme